MDLYDVDAVEAAEAQIDAFISKRHREREEVNRVEAAWAESTRRVNQKRRRENRVAWSEYERHLESVHMGLALEHRAKAEALEEAS